MSSPEVGTVLRRDFLDSVWALFEECDIAGVHEGSVDAEQARGSTESWEVDAAQAPSNRDWTSDLENCEASLYFSSAEGANAAAEILKGFNGISQLTLEQVQDQDWNLSWKAYFRELHEGIKVPPDWLILPADDSDPARGINLSTNSPSNSDNRRVIRINPGAGFGTGTHETTQLCLQWVGERGTLDGMGALDFGCGSGILAIGLAMSGAKVLGVEIDPLAIDNAWSNLLANRLVDGSLNGDRDDQRVVLTDQLRSGMQFDIVVANILKNVLIAHSEALVSALREKPRGLFLSGLTEEDVESVVQTFTQCLESHSGRLKIRPARPEIRELKEWRGLAWNFT